jgi:hypothetical protein
MSWLDAHRASEADALMAHRQLRSGHIDDALTVFATAASQKNLRCSK